MLKQNELEIRLLEPADVPALLTIIADSRAEYGMADRGVDLLEPADKALLETYKRQRSLYFVALSGGEVVGVIPSFLRDLELAHDGCDEMIVTESMHSRKQKMAELSDGFAILPGGLGTLDEAFEMITWRQLNLHDKPIVIMNIDGYWQPLQRLVDHVTAQRYMRPNDAPLFRMVDRVEDVIPALREAPAERQPLESKWI